MGSDWVPIGSDVVRLGPMGSDWVISHTRLRICYSHNVSGIAGNTLLVGYVWQWC